MNCLIFEKKTDSEEKIEKRWNLLKDGKIAGQTGGFHRNGRDYFGHCCIMDFKITDEYAENDEIIEEIIKYGIENFYREFVCGTIAVNDYGSKKIQRILEKNGFKKAKKLYLNTQEGFWIRQAVEDRFTVIPFRKNVLHITDGTSSFSTVVVGKNKALVIDTLWGTTDYSGFLEKLLTVPYEVVNTHGHPDHTFGNCQFKKVLMSPEDFGVYVKNSEFMKERLEKFSAEADRDRFLKLEMPEPLPLKKGADFDLGGVKVKSVNLAGHTKGSTGFFIEEEKILVAGDGVSGSVWLFMKESLPLEKAVVNYRKALELDFKWIISGHAKIMLERKNFETVLKNMEEALLEKKLIAGDVQKILGYRVVSRTICEEDFESSILLDADKYGLKG